MCDTCSRPGIPVRMYVLTRAVPPCSPRNPETLGHSLSGLSLCQLLLPPWRCCIPWSTRTRVAIPLSRTWSLAVPLFLGRFSEKWGQRLSRSSAVPSVCSLNSFLKHWRTFGWELLRNYFCLGTQGTFPGGARAGGRWSHSASPRQVPPPPPIRATRPGCPGNALSHGFKCPSRTSPACLTECANERERRPSVHPRFGRVLILCNPLCLGARFEGCWR